VHTDLRPPLRAATLSGALVRPGGLWTGVRVLQSTASTNAVLAAEAAAGAPEGLVVAAEQQVAGRGRLGRSWLSPPRAGLAVSVLLRPGRRVPVARWGWLPLLAGVAVARTVGRLGEVATGLKWPNDLLLGPGLAKAAGVLAEVRGDAVVLGLGLNVTTTREELAGLEATSLALEGAVCTDRTTLLTAVLRELEGSYGRWCAAAGDAEACGLSAAYRALCVTLGRPVRVVLPGGSVLSGTARAVDADGRLVVSPTGGAGGAGPDGPDVAVAAGDVVHVR